jgi:hypothetical protein
MPKAVESATSIDRWPAAQHSESIGAASAWAAARYINGVGPLWPPALARSSGHQLAELLPCLTRLLLLHSPGDDAAVAAVTREAAAAASPAAIMPAEAGAADDAEVQPPAPLTPIRKAPPAPAQESPTNVDCRPAGLFAPIPKRARV